VAGVIDFERIDCWVCVVVDGLGEVSTWCYISFCILNEKEGKETYLLRSELIDMEPLNWFYGMIV
jgi:hypothetical protein